MGIKGKASSLLEEFKAFAFKGNIVDMAIGVPRIGHTPLR